MAVTSATARSRVLPRAKASRTEPLAAGDRFALWLTLLPGIFDYRFVTPTVTTLAIYAVLVLAALCGCLTLIARNGLRPRSFLNVAGLVALAFMAETCLVGLLRGQNWLVVVRAAPALALFPIEIFAISALAAGKSDARAVWRQVVTAAALAMVVQFASVVLIRQVDLASARYEVLSGAAPLLSGYGLGILLFGGVTFSAIAIISAHAVLVILSVTRTQLVVAAVPALSTILALRGRVFLVGGLGRRLLALAAILAVALVAAAFLPGAPLERWALRLFQDQAAHHGFDVTALARSGEAKFQIDRLMSSISGLLFGFGISAPTAFDAATARLINMLVGSDNGYFTETGIGHNEYVGIFYIGGVLAGGAFLWVQLVGVLRSIDNIRHLYSGWLFSRFGSLLGAPLAFIAYMAFGLLGAIHGARSSVVFAGLTFGLTLWIYEAVRAPKPGTT